MAVNIDAIAARIEARRNRRREFGIGLWCFATEARVLGAILAEPGVLERCDEVEVDDFLHVRYQLVFQAVRNVQTTGLHADLDAVVSSLESRGYQAVTWCDLGDLIASTSNYGEQDTTQLARDIAWLRTLANRRRVA